MCNFDETKNKIKTFEGANCIEDMIIELSELSDNCILEIKKNQELKMSKEDNNIFWNATCCSICNSAFKEK